MPTAPPIAEGKDYFAYTLKKDLPFAFFFKTSIRPSKAEKELFVEQILLSDLKDWIRSVEKYKKLPICLSVMCGVLI